jgi:galactokinase/mevalonate kinase-like predicted kinase
MFPNMLTEEVAEEIEKFRDQAYGWKLSGAGGGGYLILISDTEIPNAIKVNIRRS